MSTDDQEAKLTARINHHGSYSGGRIHTPLFESLRNVDDENFVR